MNYNESAMACYTLCPYNDCGKDKATGHKFVPCSFYHRESCDIIKKGGDNKCSTNMKGL